MNLNTTVELIGSNIKQLRNNQGITQKELAELIGVSRLTIVNIEKGNNASLLTFLKILKYFDEERIISNWKVDDKPPVDNILL